MRVMRPLGAAIAVLLLASWAGLRWARIGPVSTGQAHAARVAGRGGGRERGGAAHGGLAAARVFADHSDTMLGRAMGVSLEARLTGDRTRLDRLRAMPADPVFKSLSSPTTCGQPRQNLQVWRRLAQVGEIGLLREHEAASATAAR